MCFHLPKNMSIHCHMIARRMQRVLRRPHMGTFAFMRCHGCLSCVCHACQSDRFVVGNVHQVSTCVMARRRMLQDGMRIQSQPRRHQQQ